MRKVAIFLGLCILLLVQVSAFAQQQKYRVSGTVYEADGTPLLGADVIENGTNNGTMTDDDGKFTLDVASANSIIKISFFGFVTVELPASADFSKIILKEDNQLLDEVVVIGYGTVKKGDMTGSVTAIKAEDLNRPAVTSPQQMLQGKVAGVQIIPGDGGPGSSAIIRVRGAASLNASNDPLFVIDGVAIASNAGAGMANPLSTINPNDIETFTVLKDASATAIYGSRASNGVIIITTKKGKGNNLKVSYNGSFNVVTNTKTIDVFNADEYREFVNTYYPVGNSTGDQLRLWMGDCNTDWQKQIFRTALTHDHNLSLYGNVKDRMPYRVSLGATSEQGTLVTSKSNRYTADLSVNPQFFDKHLTVTANAKGVYSDERYANSGSVNAAAFFDPTQDLYFRNADGSIDYTTTNGYWNWINSGRGENVNPNGLATVSPLSQLYDERNTATAKRFIGNLQLDYKIHGLEDLRFNLNLGMDISEGNGRGVTAVGSMQAYKDTEDRGYGQTTKASNFRRNQLLEAYLNYNKEFGIHHIDVMGGYSWQHFYSSTRTVRYRNSNGSQIGDDYNYPLYRTENYLVSFYGRANYTLNNKYLFTATLRDDASSRFSKDTRWGLFPSAAFAWNVAKENFLKNSKVLSSLKFRLSWGVTGQQEIGTGDYPYLARYVLSTDQYGMYNMGNAGYVYKLTPLAYDPNIKWETTTTYNVGIDYGFVNERITGSVDVYLRKTNDLLNSVTVPLGSNFSNTVLTNVGNMENKGVELSFNFIPIQTKDMNLNIGLNGTFQKIEFTKLTKTDDPNYAVQTGGITKGTGGFLQYHKVGYAPYTFYTYQQVYDANGKPIQNALVDRDNDGVITAADRYMTNKSPNPDFFFGINVKFDYKNWDFGLNGHGSIGNWVFNDFYSANSTSNLTLASGSNSNFSKVVMDSGFRDANVTEQWYSDMFLENASFFRLDDVNAGYTFKNFNNRGTSVRVALGVTNVFVLTKYSGLDPETNNVNGIDGNIWPRPRTFSLRLNVNF